MTRLKKVLSIVLCLSMLLGTLTVGLLSASAEDEEPSAAIPAYATLAQEAGDGDFFYAGYEFSLVDKPAEGDNPAVYKPIENGIIPGGSTLHVKYYVKTNKDLYHGKYFLVLSDKTLFPSISPVTKTVNSDVLSSNWSVKAVDSEAAGFAVYDPSEEVTVVNIDNFTAEEIDKWLIIEMDDNEKAAKPKDAGSVDKPLFEFDVKLASGKSGEFDTVMIPDSYTAYTGRNNNTVGCQYIGGTKATNKTAVSGFRLQPSQHFKIANAVTFLADDGSVIETQFPAEGDDIVPPTVNNLYKWADAEGNFVDLSNVKMGNTPLTYTAVLNTTTVEVTLNGNGGLVDGAETKVVNAPVSQTLKLSQYSAEKEGDSFKGWSINGLIAENYTFGSLKPVEVNAVWENSAMIKVVVGKVTGEWVDFVDYVGTPGEALNADSFNSIVAAVEEEFAKTGRDTIDCEEEPVYAGLNSLEYLDGYGAYLNPVTAANCSSVVVGETSYLFVSTRFIQTVNYYYPNFDADGIAIEGSWDKYKTDTY
ncbi:MAG: hypothetical protein IKS04_06660, partial [Clostridia bacterium]|nr:hypothetical protein [Clostridia bacterium]